jgi:hypothetical protein
MSVLRRLAAVAVAAAVFAPLSANAIDANDISEHVAFSSVPTLLHLCGGEAAILGDSDCKGGNYAQHALALDSALRDALDKAPATIRPLLKRDQYWFGEIVRDAELSDVPDDGDLERALIGRIVTLAQIAKGLPRAGVLGKWENAFGSVTVTAAEDGGYRLAITTDSGYGQDDEHRWHCQATAVVKPSSNGWLTGTFFPGTKQEQIEATAKSGGFKVPPFKPLAIRMRRQGETLRVVTAEPDIERDNTADDCRDIAQVTASYFPSGKTDPTASEDKIDKTFVTPTFDCARPDSPVEEEICADPELADNDQRLNRAWKALLPRLDETMRHALVDDQRLWVREQSGQFLDSFHPGREKFHSQLHHTQRIRTDVGKLQRERIALFEGFDENRKGLDGLWLGHTAVLKVEPTDGGLVRANGFKWVGDYKGGCEYALRGKLVNGTFRSDEMRKNPDTLERDHVMLIVNRLDDAFAARRPLSNDSDEQKCRRMPSISSTARLFPVIPSPDIDEMGSWHD